MVPWAHPSQLPNGISISSVVFAWLPNVTNRQTDTHTDRPTDRPRYSVYSNRPLLLAVAAMRPRIYCNWYGDDSITAILTTLFAWWTPVAFC